ncbi:MAG: hypothetical protein R3F20_17370 [Planctomycetota bacterium]
MLARYPRSLVARELSRVAIAGRLVFYRRDYGGTNDRDAIYLTCRGLDEGFDDAHLRGVLHAEFSSVLWRNHADLFDRAAFEAALPPDFSYGGSGVEVLHRRDLDASDPEDLAAGFLTRYARSSLENDLNTLVRGMMLRPEDLVALARRHPRLRAKALVVASFYESLGVPDAAALRRRLAETGD